MALSSGVVTVVDEVTVPPPLAPQRTLRLSGPTVTLIGCLLCLGFTAFGMVLGALVGHKIDESSSDFFKTRWLLGGIVGTVLGVICGVSILVLFLKGFWGTNRGRI
jgi:hypothetical protein